MTSFFSGKMHNEIYKNCFPFSSGLNVLGNISRRTTMIIKYICSSLSGVANKPCGMGNIWAINVSRGMREYQHGKHGSD